MTIKEYLHRKYTLLNTPAIINNTGHHRIYNGQLIEEKRFRKMFELPISVIYKKENPDNRKKYLGI
jgi:hypothetical protein